MPKVKKIKMKSNSSAKKRFKLTGGGKIKRKHANTSHRLRNKSESSKLKNRDSAVVSDADHKRVLTLLGLR